MSEVLLKVKNLQKQYPNRTKVSKKKSYVKAVDNVSFDVLEGETFGIVGESGCGKSTTGRVIMRLLEANYGSVEFEGTDLMKLSKRKIRKIRRHIQMIFQDPYASLNPRQTVEKILIEPLKVHGIGTSREKKERVSEFLELVGLDSDYKKRFPHQFSGGQRQRIGIARALMTNPKLVIADEPVSALDVSIQAQVLNLLKRLQEELKLTYIFISHDLGVVRYICDRVGVMYLGRMVEIAPSEELYKEPLHPYTQALLSAVPIPDPNYKKEQMLLSGDIPSATNVPSGCAFHTRCPFATVTCKVAVPELKEVDSGHYVACHLYSDVEQ